MSEPVHQDHQDGGSSGQFRTLGTLPALALVAGSMLGIGIFISPPEVAAHVSGSLPFMLMWLLGGLAALFGALSLAELGAMMPRDGGDYAYLRQSWGPGVAFAAGWLQLLAIFPGSLASVAVATAKYQLPTLLGEGMAEPLAVGGLSIPASHLWAAVIIIALTAINHVGVKVSGVVQVLVTSVPLAVLLITSLIVLLHYEPAAGAIEAAPGIAPVEPGEEPTALALAQAYLPVYFAYSGWNAAIYVGGEIKDPARNLPRALVGGTAAVTGLYLMLCVGFLAVFSLEGLAGVGEAGTAAAQAMFGPVGVTVVTGLIVLAMIGSLNGSVLTGSRIAFAMGKQGDCARAAGELHPRFATPVIALWMQCGIALALLFLDLVIFGDGLDTLIAYTSSAMLITGTLTVLAVVILRRRMPDLPRPYKTWFYPLPPALYALSSVLVLVLLAQQGDPSVWIAGGWFAGALLFYRLFRSAAPASPDAERGRDAADVLPSGR
ncbi:amino acid permease [Pseudenhygromyxa sp. WMMC2535]|uniref:amino acid permease n=1 Tax=Pseudenhygromyxa sp. WMMC2535 TaxID=2712867 RepID=UPI0015550BC6|nr:amino acid permease [Pseudenhygromyxa sp. WMMC2535]